MVVARVSLLIGTDSDSNKWEYELEDGTGRVTAVRWTINLSEDEKERLLENIPPHCYVRVIGVISEFKNYKSLNISDIRRVADAHEPFYHLVHAATVTISVEHDRNASAHSDAEPDTLESMNPSSIPSAQPTQHEPSTPTEWPPTLPQPSDHDMPSSSFSASKNKGILATTAKAESSTSSGTDTDVESEDPIPVFDSPGSHSPSPEPPSPLQNVQPYRRRDPYSHLTSLQRGILLQIHTHKSSFNEGVPVTLIVKGLAHTSRSVDDFWNAIEALMDQGMIYALSDENHLMVVD